MSEFNEPQEVHDTQKNAESAAIHFEKKFGLKCYVRTISYYPSTSPLTDKQNG